MMSAIGIPIIGAVAILVVGKISSNARAAVVLLTAGALVWVVAGLLLNLQASQLEVVQIAEIVPGITIALRAEPLGLIFAALASVLWVINSVYSIGYVRANNESNQTRFFVFFSLAIAATMGVAFSANLFTLFLFYELLTLSTYPLVAHKGDESSVRGARVYLGVLLVTSIGFFLPAIIWTYALTGTGDFVTGGILQGHIDGPVVGLLLGLFVFGVGKAAVMPVHRWLPAAMVAPTPVSALLHAVAVVKAGVFAITKIVLYIFGGDFLGAEASIKWLPYVAAFTIIAASIVALHQQNLKRMLAYSTVAQLSYIVMAIGMINPLANIGAMLHIVTHAFGKITLFFAAGAIYTVSKKTELNQLRGIGRRMPWTMLAFSIGALSMIGVPPTAGFVSKWYILAGAIQTDHYAVIATLVVSTVLNALYYLPVIYLAWFGLERSGQENFGQGQAAPTIEHAEAPGLMLIALMATAALTLLLFFFHQPVVQLIERLAHGV
ncbi:MAG: monovalent cation/H+ antiporter subunit D family protein [Gammaproteobacteria bacterium]|nr:monovalent cation/H+ antiporter subunit D family protein [Gammaproteobacteria bacterium]